MVQHHLETAIWYRADPAASRWLEALASELGVHLKVTVFTEDERAYLPISIGIHIEAGPEVEERFRRSAPAAIRAVAPRGET